MTTTETPKKEKVIIQYAINGNPITNPSVNSLSGIAYFHTKKVDGKAKGQIGVERLTEILLSLGVTEPTTTAFSVELPNGKTLSATIGKLAERVPRVKKSETPEAKAEKVKNKTRAENSKLAITQATELKKWKNSGEVGERPDTSALDAITTLREAKPSKGANKAAQVTAAVKKAGGSIKPTKANGRTVKKATAQGATGQPRGSVAKTPATKTLERKFVTPIPKAGAAKKAAS